VSSVSENAVRVAPLFRRHQLEYLRVADYGLQGILSNERIRQSQATHTEKTTEVSPDIPDGVGIVPASPSPAGEAQ
jgi:rod shape-determining protein MreC